MQGPQPGDTLGHYRILDKLGAGGMGDVFRAQDQNLGRDVAIKLLPEAWAGDASRLARFEREARLLAALNHPNVATIHGYENLSGRPVLVMELVEGDTLHDRIGGKPMRLSDVVALFTQIAAGLELAHEKGIIHRDLKPRNIMVTPSGQVKILDFGLARAFGGAEVDVASSSETLGRDITATGMVLGTPAYLSPEQARGQQIDRRSDLWAFGCVLFEALTGRKAFGGETATDTLVGILEREPDFGLVPAETPPMMLALLRRCLQKNPEERQRDVGDAGLALKEALLAPVASTSVRQPRRSRVPALALLALGVLGSWVAWHLKPTPPRAPSMRATLRLAEPALAGSRRGVRVVFSPDGTSIVYVARSDAGPIQLRFRRLDETDSETIPGTDKATFPFFSPDGQSIGFFIEGGLWRVPASGGSPELVTRSGGPARGGSWGTGGRIVYAPGPYAGLRIVAASGGESEPLTEVEEDESSHLWPQILPAGEAVLFTVTASSAENIAVQSLETGERKTIIRGASYARYIPTGHVLYSRDGSLFAVAFDEARLETEGVPVKLLDGLSRGGAFAVSNVGTLLYAAADIERRAGSLVSIDRHGAVDPLTSTQSGYSHPRLSPDERSVVFHNDTDGNIDLWLYDIARAVYRRLTFESWMEASAIWTPDGERIIFHVGQPNSNAISIHWMPIDGSSPIERLTSTDYIHSPADVSPDGRLLVFTERHPDTGADIWLQPLDGEGEPRPFLKTPYDEDGASVSPDGRFIAYVSSETGKKEVYVQPFPEGGAKVPISIGGARDPVWSTDGHELFFHWNHTLHSAEIVSAEPFEVRTAKPLFEFPFASPTFGRAAYDVTRDGRFIARAFGGGGSGLRELQVITDLFQALEGGGPGVSR